jgi:hypothetical protein
MKNGRLTGNNHFSKIRPISAKTLLHFFIAPTEVELVML